MIDSKTAIKIIQDTSPKTRELESIHIQKANKRFLAEDIVATREQPPFDRVMMDGIAIQVSSNNLSLNILDHYKIEGTQAAGHPQLSLASNSGCIEVMTGAMLPVNCNCVIPYENINIENKQASIIDKEVAPFQNIHPQGSDYIQGEVLVKKGFSISSPIAAVIASQGKSQVKVYKLPKVAIITTGTELVDLDHEVAAYQIYMSNSYAIEQELKNQGMQEVEKVHIDDNEEITRQKIQECLNKFDTIILTGGVSKGKFDYVPKTLCELGVEKHFHKIKQRPGKPMWYGSFKNKQIFALPGNPVSSLVCLRKYVIPALKPTASKIKKVKLNQEIQFSKDFTLYKPVKVINTINGDMVAEPINSNSSGDFYSLGLSDGFIELPAEEKVFKAGETFNYYPWGN